MPLRFFPKSAWLKMIEGDAKAEGAWLSRAHAQRIRRCRVAHRVSRRDLALDEPFATLAKLVFEPLVQHLRSDA